MRRRIPYVYRIRIPYAPLADDGIARVHVASREPRPRAAQLEDADSRPKSQAHRLEVPGKDRMTQAVVEWTPRLRSQQLDLIESVADAPGRKEKKSRPALKELCRSFQCSCLELDRNFYSLCDGAIDPFKV
jgi:hypothetical protein